MVFPVYDNAFKIGTKGLTSTDTDMKTIADMETFTVALDNGVEEWNPMDTKGWTRRLLTAKSLTITLNGKRNTGDAGNDYLASCAWGNGTSASSRFEWTMPDGTVITFNCVVNTSSFGGDSTNVDGLESAIMSDGKPTITPPTTETTETEPDQTTGE